MTYNGYSYDGIEQCLDCCELNKAHDVLGGICKACLCETGSFDVTTVLNQQDMIDWATNGFRPHPGNPVITYDYTDTDDDDDYYSEEDFKEDCERLDRRLADPNVPTVVFSFMRKH